MSSDGADRRFCVTTFRSLAVCCFGCLKSKMSGRQEILWSPNRNKFITWSSEVCLYEVVSLRDQTVPLIKLSNTTGAHLLATNNTHHYVKCIDIYPKSDVDLLLAIGQANGKVVLSTFGASVYDSQCLPGKELVPRHQRQCNTLAWNPIENNKIVAGLEKNRSDNSILLWDINKALAENGPPRAAAEYGLSETTHSLAWFGTNAKLMAAGMNGKTIKLIDFRDSAKAVNTTLTKAVYGINIDPHNDKLIASFFDHQVSVWDTRNFEKPLLTLPHPKQLVKVAWCPTKQNLLGSLQRDSSMINLYDIQHTMVGNEEVEPSVLERVVMPHNEKPHNITSFTWHHTDENRFLSIALSGRIVDYTIFDRITLNWASNSNLVWTCGRKTLKFITDSSMTYNSLQDISQKIKHRACVGYGLKDELWRNGELVDDDMLCNVWTWLHLSWKLTEEGILRGNSSRHPGVRSILKFDGNTAKSESISISWSELGNVNCNGTARVYKHEDRDKALHLCGWHFDKDTNSLARFVEQLEKEQAYTRAAAIAVFNLKIKMAIDILNRGSENSVLGTNLNVVAMALAGFSDDKNSMWRQFCASPKTKLNDPYLRALFAFLTVENFNYDNVLYENGMSVDDRVAFACIFLPDNKLCDYLKTLTISLMEEGNLDGILLTGNTMDGMKILQKYLDTTGDIQSTALIAIRAFNSDALQEAGRDWITSYRNLLDSWQLWNERAMFDIMLSAQRPDKPPQQVYVSCNFCGKSISAYMQGLNRGRGPFARVGGTGTANKLKMSSCPNCRKPLPRCAICLMHMGTTTGDQCSNDGDGNKLIEFSQWFTWCQTCRHGGHASHMVHWFKHHSECPVTACTCRCFSIDAI